jgi:formylglycine-generating enzyme required for sulfatase activity
MDWYDSNYYASSPSLNPQGPASGAYRVLRGGTWNDYVYYVRSADRGGSSPAYSNNYIGFRCARSTP